ncbi:MAG: SurA N-terminal domain-containing protein [Holosporales bacterium]|jgi:peptidyl-prolyl cis-trans isomerase D|nr:SurA N-terminal domain-containing protein [Holosporales bacterium]
MLKSFREASNNWVFKVLFSAIIFSFCLWGVGDIIRNYSSTKPVIKVGKTSITTESFIREYNQKKQKIRNFGENSFSDEEVKNINIKKIVTEEFLKKAILEEMYRIHNIKVPKSTILGMISSISEFQKDGIFDKNIYRNVLNKAGISENTFTAEIKANLAQAQLLHPLTIGYKVPEFIKNMIMEDFYLTKTLVIARIKSSDIKLNKPVDKEDINEYYNSNVNKYKIPESRDVSILVVDCNKLADVLEITDSEINEYYESNKESFTEKETRSFERFAFTEIEHADKARAMMMTKYTTSHEIKTKFAIDIENLETMEIHSFTKEIGSELFGLKNIGDISNIHNVGDKFFIYKLTDVSKAKNKPRNEINKEIRDILKNEKMNTPEFYQKTKDIRNKIDDGFSSGKSIETISKETNMKIITLKNIEKDKKHDPISSDELTEKEITESIFGTEEAQVSPTIDSHEMDTLSYVVYINKINKERIPDLAEIQNRVKEDCINFKKNEIAREKAEDIVNEEDRAIEKVVKLPKAKSYSVSKKDIIIHQQNPSNNVAVLLEIISNPNTIIEILTNLKKGEARHFTDDQNTGDYIVVAIKGVEKPKNNDVKFDQIITKYIDTGCQKDMPNICMEVFKSLVKIETNNKLLDKITADMEERENKETI